LLVPLITALCVVVAVAFKDASGQDVDVHRQRRQGRDAAPPPPPPLLCRRATGEELIVDAVRTLARLPQEGSRERFGGRDVRRRLPHALQGPVEGPRLVSQGGRGLPPPRQDQLQPDADSEAVSETSRAFSSSYADMPESGDDNGNSDATSCCARVAAAAASRSPSGLSASDSSSGLHDSRTSEAMSSSHMSSCDDDDDNVNAKNHDDATTGVCCARVAAASRSQRGLSSSSDLPDSRANEVVSASNMSSCSNVPDDTAFSSSFFDECFDDDYKRSVSTSFFLGGFELELEFDDDDYKRASSTSSFTDAGACGSIGSSRAQVSSSSGGSLHERGGGRRRHPAGPLPPGQPAPGLQGLEVRGEGTAAAARGVWPGRGRQPRDVRGRGVAAACRRRPVHQAGRVLGAGEEEEVFLQLLRQEAVGCEGDAGRDPVSAKETFLLHEPVEGDVDPRQAVAAAAAQQVRAGARDPRGAVRVGGDVGFGGESGVRCGWKVGAARKGGLGPGRETAGSKVVKGRRKEAGGGLNMSAMNMNMSVDDDVHDLQ
ncbi:unnamed protein product, partial [Sphagnum tenellum]